MLVVLLLLALLLFLLLLVAASVATCNLQFAHFKRPLSLPGLSVSNGYDEDPLSTALYSDKFASRKRDLAGPI